MKQPVQRSWGRNVLVELDPLKGNCVVETEEERLREVMGSEPQRAQRAEGAGPGWSCG